MEENLYVHHHLAPDVVYLPPYTYCSSSWLLQ